MTFYRTFNLTQKNYFCGALLSAILIPYQYHILILLNLSCIIIV